MSGGQDRDCGNCAYGSSSQRNCHDSIGLCVSNDKHKFPEEVGGSSISFMTLIKEALPKEKTFSLEKLIDDHWGYISNLIDVTQMHSNPKEKKIAEFHYKTAAIHFWKHCKEHYNIKESTDE